MNLTINHDQAYSVIDLGDFPLGDVSPMSANGTFSWYASGSVNGAYAQPFDHGTNVTSDTLDIPAGAMDVTMHLTGQVPMREWYGDSTGIGQFTLSVGVVPEPASAAMLAVALVSATLFKMVRK